MKQNTYLGIMSGTSLDGLDLALCEFNEANDGIDFKLIASETIHYDSVWKENLTKVFGASALDYFKLNSLYGIFIGEKVNEFLSKQQVKPNYIASHGHTVFHQPALGLSTQIGCGATIAAITGIDTVCDFRSLDVALHGQGAPLVPIGDRDLFSVYESCLNLGGIANISFTKDTITKAFDICMVNLLLNYLALKKHVAYDKGGEIASKGIVSEALLNELLTIETQQQSLGREIFETQFLPVLENNTLCVEDKMATCIDYIAIKLNNIFTVNNLTSVFVTGGGAYNNFLINRLKQFYKGHVFIPEPKIIEFKEAIIFAYLGYLRIHNKINTLNSVTQATKNSIGACVYKA